VARDPILADFPRTPATSGVISALLEELARARDALLDARLASGEHREVVALLHELTTAEPLHEHRWEQLMFALYRSSNQAEALDAYARARTVLVEEYGIEPGPGLQDLHQRILTADPALAMPSSNLGSGARSECRGSCQASSVISRAAAMNWHS
jgi:DNA-binding SARP family transcriptional activator